MKKAKFIQLAVGLGIAVPACLLGLVDECHASVATTSLPKSDLELINKEKNNQIKEQILNLIGTVDQSSAQQLSHTNIHANYTISHTDVHTDYVLNGSRRHCNQHSNTPSHHVDDHSNSRV